jgi:hypothetical protein
MKHNVKITAILLVMFVLTQLIGLVVLSVDPLHVEQEVNGTMQLVDNPHLAFVQPPENSSPVLTVSQIIFAFIIAIFLMFFLMKFNITILLKFWFFVVVFFALWICIYSFEKLLPWEIPSFALLGIPVLIAGVLAYLKIYQRNFLIHNLTELFIYPGIAVIFVAFLGQWSRGVNLAVIISILILISLYDLWAVWHSGIMQKMAKFQMKELNVFAGFFVPYVSKKVRMKIKEMKKSKIKDKKIKVNVAILGGGDVVFPLITAGIMLQDFGLGAALFVILGATIGLSYLFFLAEKKKFYPAMPFISAGIFLGMFLSWLVF